MVGNVCCEPEKAWLWLSIKYVCAEMETKAACEGGKSVCASGDCGMDNLCLADELQNESPCKNGNQCSSGACGRGEGLESAGNVCCESKKAWLGLSSKYVCKGDWSSMRQR